MSKSDEKKKSSYGMGLRNRQVSTPINDKSLSKVPAPNKVTPFKDYTHATTPKPGSDLNSSQHILSTSPSKILNELQFLQQNYICSMCKTSILDNLATKKEKINDLTQSLNQTLLEVDKLDTHLKHFLLKPQVLENQFNNLQKLLEDLTNAQEENKKHTTTMINKLNEISTSHIPRYENNDLSNELSDIKSKIDDLSNSMATETPKLGESIAKLDNISTYMTGYVEKCVNDKPTSQPLKKVVMNIPDPFIELKEDFLDSDASNSLLRFLDEQTFEKKTESRDMLYYGEYRYKYGNIEHPPIEPPTEIQAIIDKLNSGKDKPFTINSCLITRYIDGTKFCPSHQDDEIIINPDSVIMGLSVGAERTIKFTPSSGFDHQMHEIKLPNNSLLSFSRVSNEFWRHEIVQDPQCSNVRYSLTFRDMRPHFKNYTYLIGDSNIHRIVFGSGKGKLGDWMPGKLVKSARISAIPSPSELLPARNIIIHTGINDIRDHSKPLCPKEMIASLEVKCSEIMYVYPRMKIYISPILPTTNYNLNQHVMEYNQLLINLSRKYHNMFVINNNSFAVGNSMLDLKFARINSAGYDMVHLNKLGVSTLASSFKSYICGNRIEGRHMNYNIALKSISNKNNIDYYNKSVSDVSVRSGVGRAGFTRVGRPLRATSPRYLIRSPPFSR